MTPAGDMSTGKLWGCDSSFWDTPSSPHSRPQPSLPALLSQQHPQQWEFLPVGICSSVSGVQGAGHGPSWHQPLLVGSAALPAPLPVLWPPLGSSWLAEGFTRFSCSHFATQSRTKPNQTKPALPSLPAKPNPPLSCVSRERQARHRPVPKEREQEPNSSQSLELSSCRLALPEGTRVPLRDRCTEEMSRSEG